MISSLPPFLGFVYMSHFSSVLRRLLVADPLNTKYHLNRALQHLLLAAQLFYAGYPVDRAAQNLLRRDQ